jgi:ribose transport system permease protein
VTGVAPTADRTPTEDAAARRRPATHSVVTRFGVLGAFVITCIVFAALKPNTFVTSANVTQILTQAAPLAALALGLTIVLSMGDFDLSVTAMANLAGAVAVALMSEHGWGWPVAVIVGLVVAVIVGAGNGVIIAYAGASSFIVTLAAGTILTGAEYTFTHQATLFANIPHGYVAIGQGTIAGINYTIIIAAVLFGLVYLLLDRTELGRRMRAVGGNPEAAHLAGIDVRRLRLVGFIIVAVCGAVAGFLVTAQASSSTPDQATSLLLPAFAGAFLGSASFRPGEFNAQGTLLGVLFLSVIQNGLTVLSASPSVIDIVQGVILILAVVLTRIGRRIRDR